MKLNPWKQIVRGAVVSLGLLISAAAVAQSNQELTNAEVTLRAGTPVMLLFSNDLSSETIKEGATVSFVLANNLTVGRSIIVKAGTQAFGKVTEVVKAEAGGRSGALALRLEPLQVGHKFIRLRASEDGGADVRYERPYNLKFPLGLFRTGDDVEIRTGTLVTVFVADDVLLPGLY